jgi:methionine-rich copper-binding protein CopC
MIMSVFLNASSVGSVSTFRRVLVALAGVATAFVVTASTIPHPASAHSELIASTPETGSTVSDVAEVSLTFGEEIVGEYTTLSLANESGEQIELDAPTMDATNTVVTTRIIAAPLVDGTYALGYYIVSIDGHPIEGTISFVVSGSPAPVPVVPTETANPEPEPTATETPIAVDGEARLLVTSSGASNPEMTWVWVGTGVAAVAVLGAVSAVLLIALRRRRDSESTTK